MAKMETTEFSISVTEQERFSRSMAIWQPWFPVIVALFVTIIVLGLVTNGAAIVAFFGHMKRMTVTDCLNCSLSCADFFSLISFAPFCFFSYTQKGISIVSQSKTACLVTLAANQFGIFSSLVLILTLSVHRLRAVLTPVTFKEQRKTKSLLAFILLPWCFLVVVVSLPSFGWNSWARGQSCAFSTSLPRVYLRSLFLVPCLSILMAIPPISACTFWTLVKKLKKVEVTASDQTPSTENNKIGAGTKGSLTQISARKHMKVSKTLLITVGCLYACILPSFILFIADKVGDDLLDRVPTAKAAFDLTRVLVALNSVLNPLIYLRKNPRFAIWPNM